MVVEVEVKRRHLSYLGFVLILLLFNAVRIRSSAFLSHLDVGQEVAYAIIGITLTAVLITFSSRYDKDFIRKSFRGFKPKLWKTAFGLALGVFCMSLRYLILFKTNFIGVYPFFETEYFILILTLRAIESLMWVTLILGFVLKELLRKNTALTSMTAVGLLHAILQVETTILTTPDASTLLSAEAVLGLAPVFMLYFTLSYAYVITRGLWLPAAALLGWSISDYGIVAVLRPNLLVYNGVYDSVVTTILLAGLLFAVDNFGRTRR